MPIMLTCLCGNVFGAREDQAGQTVACFSCGYLNHVSNLGSAAAGEKSAAAPIAAEEVVVLEFAEPELQALPLRNVPPASEDVIEVVPLETDEDGIPEIDVEEHVPPWQAIEPYTGGAIRSNAGRSSVDPANTKKPSSEFERNAESAGQGSWATIGTIRLVEPAGCLAYGPGGVLGLAGQDDEVLVLNMRKGKKLDRFGAHDEIVTCAAISSTGDCAVSGDRLGDIFYWDVVKCKRLRQLRGCRRAISAVAFSPDGNYAAAGDRDGAVRLWKLTSSKDRSLDDADWDEKIASLAFSADGALVAAGSDGGRVAVWSATTGGRVVQFRLPQRQVASVQFGTRPGLLFVATRPIDSKAPAHPGVWRLDLKSKQAQECFVPTVSSTIAPGPVVLDQGAKRLLVAGVSLGAPASGATCLQVWGLTGSRLLYSFHDVGDAVTRLAVTPGGTRVAVALTSSNLQVFALPDHESLESA